MNLIKIINNKRHNFIISNYIYKLTYKKQQYDLIINYSKYYTRKSREIIKHIFISVLFSLSYYFYYLSLESCFDGEGPCSSYINWIKRKIKQELISCLLLSILLQLIFIKKISILHLIHIIIIFFFFTIIDMV